MTTEKLLDLRAFLLIPILIFIISCSGVEKELAEPGISKKLAELRKSSISNLAYQLHFDISKPKSERIKGNVQLTFDYQATGNDLMLDFNSTPKDVSKLIVNDQEVSPVIENEHIIIDENLLARSNKVEIEFLAGEQSLNRKEEFLYTLFVPERASTCFPLFDQPDLKARYNLSLTIPDAWKALANAKAKKVTKEEDKRSIVFEETKPISSYLFAFAVGDFQVVEKSIDGDTMRMYHRETDTTKVANNLEAIFEWHKRSITWLEEYTSIDFQFDKMDFVLIPSFQYGGMEHPGSIFYKSSSLMLDESATLNQELGRARLIAHEVSHMWFGNLVTMSWFDDVWLKEVFANFMASKIVDPGFPEVNHDLKFLMSHYPSAYAVDRSLGTHPIKQELNNLKNAGSLYGSIIYQKAPIVMKMLEDNVGEESFQKSMQEYLDTYQFDNATWEDLLSIVSKNTDYNIKAWNERWVKTAGMPIVYYSLKVRHDKISRMSLFNRVPSLDDEKASYIWPQQLGVVVGAQDTVIQVKSAVGNRIDEAEGLSDPEFIFTNTAANGYGFFNMGSKSKVYFLENMSEQSELMRGALWLNYYELLLRKRIEPGKLINTLIKNLPLEENNLIAEYMLDMIKTIFWLALDDEARAEVAPKLEGLLLNMAVGTTDDRIKASYFNTLRSLAITANGVNLLRNFWNQEMEVEGLEFSERDYTQLAYALALRDQNPKKILDEQFERITNPDRKERFAFVRQALARSQSDRDEFFESLKMAENRENEEWVLEALSYLHHPLRAKESVKYILPSLELLEEIKRTGDIFFPKRWLDQTLSGHSSKEAENAVRQFLYSHNDYPKDLKNKLLQAADLLMRIEDVRDEFKDDGKPDA